MPEAGRVVLELVDVVGHRVATLVDRTHSAGRYTVSFDASRLASGFYLYRLRGGGRELVREMVVIR